MVQDAAGPVSLIRARVARLARLACPAATVVGSSSLAPRSNRRSEAKPVVGEEIAAHLVGLCQLCADVEHAR
jgi:hypothetical protein